MATGPDPTPLIDEQLSAWLDDELPREELELLTRRLAQSPEYQAQLARYSLIGSTLRGRQADGGTTGLAALQLGARVRAALDESATPERQVAPVRRGRVPYALAAGLALVAAAAVVVQGPLWRPVPAPVQASAQPMLAAPAPLGQASLGQASLSSRRLTNYLVYHGEYSGLLSTRVTESHIVNGRTNAVALRSPTE